MQNKNENFVPALGFHWATKFYDPLVRIFTREKSFKKSIITQANILEGQTILDLACGTGTLSIEIKKLFPGSKIFAIDADPKILEKAIKKATEKGLKINFQKHLSAKLPFKNETFEKVFSTLAFHHLSLENKIDSINEILRILKPGGEFHMADYGLPASYSQTLLSGIITLIDGEENTKDNINGCLGNLLKENGFKKVIRTGNFKTLLGTIRLFKSIKF